MKTLIMLLVWGSSLAWAQLGGSRQLIVSVGENWNSNSGSLQLFEKTSGVWHPVGAPWKVVYGDSGMGWGLGLHTTPLSPAHVKHEGDRRSPAGVFALGTLCGYDSAAPSGVTYPYTRSLRTTRFVDDPQSKFYNSMIDEKIVPARKHGTVQWRSAEHMKFVGIDYKYVIVVMHNPERIAGKGSAIFLHLNSPARRPTAGCTAMDEPEMLTMLRRLDPKKQPLLVQLPRAEYATYRTAWGLPELPVLIARIPEGCREITLNTTIDYASFSKN